MTLFPDTNTTWSLADRTLDLATPRVMAIVNVTPDSFSDGGLYYRPEEAIARARNCAREGADVVDLGGESTRPDAAPIAWSDEWARLEPVLAGLAGLPAKEKRAVSVDTYHPETAARAVAAGAAIVNCVKPEAVPAMLELSRRTGCGLVLPCRGAAEYAARTAGSGVDAARVVVDPMIGFGTTREEDLALLARLGELAACRPVCLGVSRKRLIKKLTGDKGGTGKNVGGSVAAAVWGALHGASLLRVHDVAETVSALRVVAAFEAAAGGRA